MNPQISCVSGTVTGRLPMVKKMVASFRRSAGKIPYEIILVAGACAPDHLAWIRGQEDCVLVDQKELLGSTKAYQAGFEMMYPSSRYAVTGNDDVTWNGNGIQRAYEVLESNPGVGQVAFGHMYQNRNPTQKKAPRVQGAFGYPYGQCCMTRRSIGDLNGWCRPDLGWRTYAWDTHLGMVVWHSGYEVVPVKGCSVVDWEVEDDIRKNNSQGMRLESGAHPDSVKFMQYWKGRLPPRNQWVPASSDGLIFRALHRKLRVLKFKTAMNLTDRLRHGMIDAFARYGPTKQVNQTLEIKQYGIQGYHMRVLTHVKQFRPDLILFQAQRPGQLRPQTIREAGRVSGAYVINWDGDSHFPLLPWHAEVAKAADLQLMISPDLFDWYHEHDVHNIGYWPISVEAEYLEAKRRITSRSPDVAYLTNLHTNSSFPDTPLRRAAGVALHEAKDVNIAIYGRGWHVAGIQAEYTREDHKRQGQIYAGCRMGLSISQTHALWGYTSDRLYNISASGCAPLVKRFKGMGEHGYVDGDTCIAWDTVPEMMKKVRYYKKHPDKCEMVARNTRQLILDRHCCDKRVEQLFEILGGIDG